DFQISGADRSTSGDFVADEWNQIGVLPRDSLYPRPNIAGAPLHTKSEQWLKGDNDQAGRMAPVLKESPRGLVRGPLHERRIVRSKPGEQWHEMGPSDDID